ncbi:hypothetical protein BD770DRAFT_395131 [Pilaira anomala]|nr:hypothetical protein BD770DRAFT_395131 [Pilaira anomala]
MTVSSNGTTKRLTSLEAAGVKSSSSTTTSSVSSTSTTTTTGTRKRIPSSPATNTTTRTTSTRASMTPTSLPTRTSMTPTSVPKRATKTPLAKSNSSSVKVPLTPVPKKKSFISSTGTTTTTTATSNTTPRSPSRASSRATTPHSSSTSLATKKKSVIPIPSVTTDSIAIQKLKDKNDEIQTILSQKEFELEEKEVSLKELLDKVNRLESTLESQKKEEPMVEQAAAATEEVNYKALLASQQEEALELQRQVEKELDLQKQIEKELLETIVSLENQSNELKQSFDQEKMDLIQQHETAEIRHRDCMEKLREKLENEKLALSGNLFDKERDIEKLKKDMDDMRDNIKEMHQSHQTRLTTLTNQLNQQYSETIDKLKLDHQDEKLKYEETEKELELLKSKYEQVNVKYDALQKERDEDHKKFKERELVYIAELDKCKNELKITQSEVSDIALLKEQQHASFIKELKESHDQQLKETVSRLEKATESRQNEISELEIQVSILNQKLELAQRSDEITDKSETELEHLVTKLQLEHEVTIQQMKEQHLTTLNELKKTHNEELEHAESKIDSCVQSTRADESTIQKLQTNEQLLKEELSKLKSQLQNQHLEMELKVTEKLKLAELKLSQKYQVLQETLEAKYKHDQNTITKLESELKEKYEQSTTHNQVNDDELKVKVNVSQKKKETCFTCIKKRNKLYTGRDTSNY